MKLSDKERAALRAEAATALKQDLRNGDRRVSVPTRHVVVPASFVLALLDEVQAEQDGHAKTAKQLVDAQTYAGCLEKKIEHAVQLLGGQMAAEEHQ